MEGETGWLDVRWAGRTLPVPSPPGWSPASGPKSRPPLTPTMDFAWAASECRVIASAVAAAGRRKASAGFIDMEMVGWLTVRDTGAWKAEAQATQAMRSLAIIATKGDDGAE